MRQNALVTLLCMLAAVPANAGTNGSVEGNVRDGKTGEPLPGANVFIVEVRAGASTDIAGRYVLRNVRAGTYSIRFTHVGYTPRLVRGVLIDPDRRMVVDVSLNPSDVPL